MPEDDKENGAPDRRAGGDARSSRLGKAAADSEAKAKEPSGAAGRTPAQPVEAQPSPPRGLPSGQQQPDAAGEGPPVERIIPPDIHQLRLPLVGRVPLRTVGILACLAALAFLAVLIVGLVLRGRPEPPPSSARPARAAVAVALAREGAAEADLSQLGYTDLMEGAERSAKGGDLSAAASLYRAAGSREDAGLPKVLLARSRLSEVLLQMARPDEALRICEALRSVSRPGDELWKSALTGSIRALGQQQQWDDYFRQVYLLRANTARYGDRAALDRWLAYCQAMARVRMCLARSKDGGALYGVRPPPFGQAPCAVRPLMAEDIAPASGKYGDGTLTAQYAGGELRLQSEGAPLGKVLAEISRVAGLTITFEGAKDYPVTASLETLSPENGLELVLGSVGLAADAGDGRLTIRRMDPVPKSKEGALTAALWALQEFLILYPESVHVPEAYYALSHLYMSQGQTKMALDQLEILSKEFPESPWTLSGHYVAGRALTDLQDWAGGERELLAVVDKGPDSPLSQPAFLWAAQCEVEMRKYKDAVACFRRALASQVQDPLTPTILYKIAYCLEKSGASPLEVEERYMELRTRYPGTEYAREADYRLGRMALDNGDYAKAVTRYEFYLITWPIQGERSRQACADLVQAYVRAGEDVRAALLGEVMCSAFGAEAQYRQALPLVLEAHEKAGMEAGGLDLIDRSAALTDDPEQRLYLSVAKAGFLANLQRYDEAEAILAQVEGELQGKDVAHEAKLVRAKVLAGRGEPDKALSAAREAAINSHSEDVRARALTLMAHHFEAKKEFGKAALAYAGKCPVESARSAP